VPAYDWPAGGQLGEGMDHNAAVASADPVRTASDDASRAIGTDWLVAGLSIWLVCGFYTDLYAHRHGIVDNSFLTPWHALLYSGAAAFGVSLGLIGIRRMGLASDLGRSVAIFLRRMARSPRDGGLPLGALLQAIPRPYRISFLGALLFVAAGPIDLIWHASFGFELDVETLLSPPHLLLATSGVLMVVGPLRSAWYGPRSGQPSWATTGPAVISLVMVFAVFAAFTQYANPISHVLADSPGVATTPTARELAMQDGFVRSGWGASSILVYAALLSGFVLAALRRRSTPPGAIVAIVAVPVLMMVPVVDEWRFIPAAILAGIGAELVVRSVGFGQTRRRDLVIAFVVPALWFAAYFATLAATTGIAWTATLWLGAIILAGTIGLLLNELTRSGLGVPAERL
jgi:hypothetical protein